LKIRVILLQKRANVLLHARLDSFAWNHHANARVILACRNLGSQRALPKPPVLQRENQERSGVQPSRDGESNKDVSAKRDHEAYRPRLLEPERRQNQANEWPASF
jgi:hypothetical protein